METRTSLKIFCFSILLIIISAKSYGQCNAKYASLPYTQDFESWINLCGVSDAPDSSWINSYPNDITIADTTLAVWRSDAYNIWEDMGYNSDEWYSPPTAHGNYSARFHTAETVDSNGISSNGNLDLHISLSSTTGIKALSFYYINESGYDSMTVSLSSDSGATFTPIGSYTVTAGWTQYILPINSNSPKAVIRFTGTSIEGYNGGDDIGLDYVQVYTPLDYNVSVLTQNIVLNPIDSYIIGTLKYANYIQKNSSNVVSGELVNYGGKTVTSMNLDWSINGGKINTTPLTSLNIAPFAYYNYTSVIPMVPSVDGNDTLKIWVDSINGSNPDQNPSIDTLSTDFVVIDTVEKKKVLLEDFGQASCDPCAIYMANLDSVYQNSKKFCNIIRYHVDWPGQDFMNDETQSQVVVRQQDLYGITSVPFAYIDGQIGLSTGALFSPLIYAESYPGTPIKITGTYNYDISTHTHTVSATVKSFANFPAGLNLYAVIIDSLAYTKNQSTESIPQYYFPEVVEEILPNATGGALGEFKDDTSQSVTYTWNQTHPLGADFSSFPYDSGNYAVIIFVQDPTTNVIYQSLSIPATVTTGIDELNSGLTKVNAYPNPFNNTISLSMNLQKNENVIVKLSDILGREILVNNEGSLSSGEHTFMYDVSSLPSGIYLLEIQTDDGSLSLKVIKSN